MPSSRKEETMQRCHSPFLRPPGTGGSSAAPAGLRRLTRCPPARSSCPGVPARPPSASPAAPAPAWLLLRPRPEDCSAAAAAPVAAAAASAASAIASSSARCRRRSAPVGASAGDAGTAGDTSSGATCPAGGSAQSHHAVPSTYTPSDRKYRNIRRPRQNPMGDDAMFFHTFSKKPTMVKKRGNHASTYLWGGRQPPSDRQSRPPQRHRAAAGQTWAHCTGGSWPTPEPHHPAQGLQNIEASLHQHPGLCMRQQRAAGPQSLLACHTAQHASIRAQGPHPERCSRRA